MTNTPLQSAEGALDGAALRNTSRFQSAGIRTHDPNDFAFPGSLPVTFEAAALIQAVIHRCGGSAGITLVSAPASRLTQTQLRTDRKTRAP